MFLNTTGQKIKMGLRWKRMSEKFSDSTEMYDYYLCKSEAEEIPFDDRYGNDYPSVTTMISFFNDEGIRYYTDESMMRGKIMHSHFEKYLSEGNSNIPEIESVKNERNYYRSFIRWGGLCHPTEAAEKKVIGKVRNSFNYNGTIDYIGKSDEGYHIVDFKTGIADSKWWAVQTAGYAMSVKNEFNVITCGALRVKKTGGWPLYTKHTPINYYKRVFESVTALFYHFNLKAVKIDSDVELLFNFINS